MLSTARLRPRPRVFPPTARRGAGLSGAFAQGRLAPLRLEDDRADVPDLLPFRDPAFRSAFKATIILFAIGFFYLELTGYLTWQADNPPLGTQTLLPFVTAVLLGAGLTAVVLVTTGWRNWLRVPAIAAAFVAVIALQSLVDIVNMWAVGQRLNPAMQAWAQVNWPRFVRASFIYFWVYGVNLALILFAVTNNRLSEQRRELAEARAEASQAQLAMLRYQLNPHFLFNTLNAISSLVVTARPAEAEDMLSKLSSFLRASLASEPDDYVRLDAELDVVQEYLDIERVRFGARLAVAFACEPEAAPILVPSFLLQPLVENAIKYAVGPARRTITIRIDARIDGDDLLVMVADDGDGMKEATRSGTGVGLRNVRERLRTLYGDRGVLEAVPLEQGFLAIVRLPARTAGRG